jgi:hypothetical protein
MVGGGVNLSTVMDQIAGRLDVISPLRVVAYPDGQINAPAGIVCLPTRIDFGVTYQDGADRLELPLVVLVSGTVPRVARDALATYCGSSGASSVKAVLESGAYTAFDFVTVTECQFDVWTYNGEDYPAAIFTLDIVGSGD